MEQHIMKRILSAACLLMLFGGLTGCQTCDDLLPSCGPKFPRLSMLEKLKHGGSSSDCGCDNAMLSTGCNTCGSSGLSNFSATGGGCSTCGGNSSALLDGGLMNGGTINTGYDGGAASSGAILGSSGSGCNCGGNSSGASYNSGAVLGESISVPSTGGSVISGGSTLGGSVIGNRSTSILPGAGE